MGTVADLPVDATSGADVIKEGGATVATGTETGTICVVHATGVGTEAAIKAILSRPVGEILDRLGSSAAHWQARLETRKQGQLVGRDFAASRQRLRDVGVRPGPKRVPNPGGCPAS